MVLSLRNGQTTICECHAHLVTTHKWQIGSNGYVMRSGNKREPKTLYIHRVINNTPSGYQTDHINGDKLDNRCSNLRSATRSQNGYNKPALSNNTSGYKGVTWSKVAQKWQAKIKHDGKVRHLGYFTTAELAAQTYKEAAAVYHGEFAN